MSRPLPSPWTLTWPDVDPARREFDPAQAPAVVTGLPPAADVPPPGTDWRLVDIWYDRITAALVQRYGDWAVGWAYTVEMTDTAEHGLIPCWRSVAPVITTADEVLAGIAAALVAWYDLLVELATDPHGRFIPGRAADGVMEAGPPAWRAVMGSRVKRLAFPEHPRMPHPRDLSWTDVDPAGRDPDPESVLATVTAVAAAATVPARDADWRLRDLWLETVTRALVDRYGLWAVGWRWSTGEGDLDGGVVTAWCCSGHSLSTPDATAAAITAAVLEWHGWLVDLADRFGRFLPLPADDPLDSWERAVAHRVTAVGDRTYYESGWYNCCRTALGWFLTAAGVESADRPGLIDHAVGRFRSWAEPSSTDVRTIAELLAERVVHGA
ncbi:hypothetical protein [Hamadaea tsunoensis]|uniref:hypothetical protein n=1 Tax=Hamadaea tsunoensis TaxID=53368 RepID=UPI0012F7F0CF|nr:hypothetical protein [Hamadaea tsunoensis]